MNAVLARLLPLAFAATVVVQNQAWAQYYFDAGSAAGLNPTGDTVVEWNSAVWQNGNPSPGVGVGGVNWANESSVVFQTGGVNRLSVSGKIIVNDLTQDLNGTTTLIGGSGTLELRGAEMTNWGAQPLHFLEDLTIHLAPPVDPGDTIWNAVEGDIVVDGIISGAAPGNIFFGGGLTKIGQGTLYLNGANTYTGNTTLTEGTVVVGSTTAFGESNLYFTGGTLQYGTGIVTDFSSRIQDISGNGATIDTNGNNITFSNDLVGSGTFTKTGDGRLTLKVASATAASYAGKMVVEQGTLAFSISGLSFNINYKLPSGGIEVKSGATLDISDVPTTITSNAAILQPVWLEGRGVDGLGALVKNATPDWNPGFANMILTGHTTIGTTGNRLDIDGGGTANAQGYSLTKIGAGAFNMDASLLNLGNVYVKAGAVGFHGGSSLGYYNNGLYGDTVFFNSGAGMSNWERGSTTKKIALNGGYIGRTGRTDAVSAANAVFTAYLGLQVLTGHSQIRHSANSLTQQIFQLGTIDRKVGAALDINDTSGLTGLANPILARTDTLNANGGGIIGGYFTYGNNTWAVSADSGTNIAVTGLTSYHTDLDPTTWGNMNVSLGASPSGSIADNLSINSLRLTAASTLTIDAAAVLTLESGGLLVTGSGLTGIGGGGTLKGTAGKDLVIHQNASQALTISATIADNGTATALTKTGAGTLILSGTNTYTGHTYVNGIAGGAGAAGSALTGSSKNSAVLQVTTILTDGNDNLGSTGNKLFLNDGLLRYANTTTDAVLAREVNLLSGGGFFDVNTAGRVLEISGKITGEELAGDEGWFYNQGSLVKEGAGILVISHAANDYKGSTIVNAGTLRLGGSGRLGMDYNYLYVNNAGTILDLNGTSQSVGLLAGNNATAYIQNGGSGNSVLTVGVNNSSSGADLGIYGSGSGFQGVIRDNAGSGSGTMSLVKTGAGIQILTGANSYTGTTLVQDGILQIGAGATSASTASRTGTGLHTVASGAILSGNGVVGGNAVIEAGGLLSVGNHGQTVAQTLTFNGSLTSNGTISLDVWGVGLTDMLKFTTDSAVNLNGSLILNNLSGITEWSLGASLQLIDWGSVSLANRNVNFTHIDLGSLGTLGEGEMWDFGRFESSGVIRVMVDVLDGALRWDAATGTFGAQDGSGIWTTDNHWWNSATAANEVFASPGSVIFGSGSGLAGTVTVAAPGVEVEHVTFQATGGGTYLIDGPGAITLGTNSWITAQVDAAISAELTGADRGFTKAGAGTLTLLGNNSYTGTTTLYSGVLEVTATQSLGTGGANSIVFDGGTLRHGRGLTTDFSARFAEIGAAGATVDTHGNDLVYATSLSGAGTFIKTGDGRLLLSGATNTYAGRIIVDQGILALGSRNVFGVSTGLANGIVVRDGATLDLSPVPTGELTSLTQEWIELYGRGVDQLGSLVLNTSTDWYTGRLQNFYLRSDVTIGKSNSSRLNVNGDAGGFGITLVGNGHFTTDTFNNMGSVYVKAGQYMMQSSSFGDVNDAVVLNSGAYMSFWERSNTLNKKIVLNGGAILRTGGSTAAVGVNGVLNMVDGVALHAGHAELRHSSSQMIFQLNEIQRETGGTLNVQDTSLLTGFQNPAMATTTTANTNGILGGYLTYGKNTWAVNSGGTLVGGKANVIVGLATADYDTDFLDGGNNVDVTASNQTPGADFTVNSLRFNEAGAVTLTLSGSNALNSGGILVTSNVGSNAVTITGGTLMGAAGAEGDLIIHQNNANGFLTINSVIANRGADATGLTKSGPGTLVLGAINTYGGNTYINGDAGGGATGEIRVSTLSATENDNLGVHTNELSLNNGRLRYMNTTTNAETSRAITLLSGGGRFLVETAGVTLTLSGKITGEILAGDEGWYWGQGTFYKEGAGTVVITNGDNDYTGGTTVTAGTLRLSGAGRLGADHGYLSVTNGILDLGGTSQTVGLLSSTSTGGIIQNSGSGSSILTVGTGNASSGANGSTYGSGSGYQGIIRDNGGTGSGTMSLVKVGTGIQILSGASTYTGTTEVREGILQVGSGTAATTTARTGSGLHTVFAGATLAGNGIVGGNTVVDAGGLISVGNFGQTAAQTLAFNGGLVSNGVISLDVWGAASTDQIKFTGNGEVVLAGRLILNNSVMASYGWQTGEVIKLIDWGSTWLGNRDLEELFLDMATLGLADSVNNVWDTSRLGLDGTIFVRGGSLLWDAETGSTGAQDGAGTWTTDNHWWNGSTNVSFVSDGTQNVVFGAGTGNGAVVAVNRPGGIAVKDITFHAVTGAGADKYYTISSGGAGADGTLTLAATSWVTTDHAYEADYGSTISAVIAGTTWTKAGQGRLILTGTNTFTGNLTVMEGVLDIRSDLALGATAGNTLVTGGATLEVRGGRTVAENLILNGRGHQIGQDGIGALRNNAGNNTFSGTISLGTSSQVTSRAGTLTLSGIISGAGALIITGEDTSSIVQLTGSGHNTYTGGTIIESGELRLGKNRAVNAIAAGTQVSIGTGDARAVLRLAQHDQIADTGTVLGFAGIGTNSGVFQLFGFSETVGGIESTGGAGIIENGNTSAGSPSTLTVRNVTDYLFSGIMRNGSNGWFSFIKEGTGRLTLTGDNTYSGTTVVRGGVLELAGSGGRISGAGGYSVSDRATLRLTGTAGANHGDRLNDAAKISLAGGVLDFSHDAGAADYAETTGDVEVVAGSNVISSSQAASDRSSSLILSSLLRLNGAMVTFSGDGLGLDERNQVIITGASDALFDHGMMGAWMAVGNQFAKYGDHGVTAFTASDYETGGETAWTFDKNVKTAVDVLLTQDRNINSLNLEQTGEGVSLDLGGHDLRIESGGLMISGAYNTTISNGTLTAGTGAYQEGELIIHQNAGAAYTLEISAAIGDNGTQAVGVTKGGDGALLLSGQNTFTGGLTVNDGTVTLAAGASLADGNDLTVQAGRFDFNGHNLVVGKLASEVAANTGVIENLGAEASLTVGAGGASSAFYGSVRGALEITKTGAGVITLGGNNTYTGQTIVEEGTLRIGNQFALGTSGSAATGTIVHDGATLDVSDMPRLPAPYQEYITVSGHGVDGLGVITKNSPEEWNYGFGYLFLDGHVTLNSSGGRFDVEAGGSDARGYSITKIGTSGLTFDGTMANLGNLYAKQSSIQFAGAADMGQTNRSVYVLTGAGLNFWDKQADAKGVVLRGGSISRNGSSATSVSGSIFDISGGLVIEAGHSELRSSNSALVFQLNSINRATGATLNVVSTTSTLATTTTQNTNGILGGYATYGATGGTTWAVGSTDGTATAITGLNSYETSATATDWAATENVSLGGNASGVGTQTINSLRLTAASTVTIGTGNTLTLHTGGLLVTGTGATAITGGTLTGAAGRDLIIVQNSSATLTINSVVANNGGPTALTRSGAGTVVLTGNNTYSGGTYIHGQAGGGTRGMLSVSKISDTGDSNLGQSAGGSNGIHLNNGILEYTGTVDATTGRLVELLSGGAEIRISGSGALTLEGVVSGEEPTEDEGFYAGQGTFTKGGNGSLTLGGVESNTYTGDTFVSAGTLFLDKVSVFEDQVHAINGNIFINNTSLLVLLQSHQIRDTAIITLNNSGIFRLNGQSETVGGLAGTSTSASVENGGDEESVLTVDVATGKTYTYAGGMQDGNGPLKFVKEGEGTQVLAGAVSHSGGTDVNEGVLQIGNGGTMGSLGTGDVAIAAGAELVLNVSADFTVSQNVTGGGVFTQAGQGTTVLEAGWNHGYTGGTQVKAGKLLVNSELASPVAVTGGVLGGNGVIHGNVIVKGSGQINPGAPDGVFDMLGLGALTVDGDLVFTRPEASSMPRLVLGIGAGGGTYHDADLAIWVNEHSGDASGYFSENGGSFISTNYDVSAAGLHDQLFVSGELTFEAGATVLVENLEGYEFQMGDVFNLMDWAQLNLSSLGPDRAWSADFDLLLPELSGSNLRWDTSLFGDYGIVFVSAPEPGRAGLLVIALAGALLRRRRRHRRPPRNI